MNGRKNEWMMGRGGEMYRHLRLDSPALIRQPVPLEFVVAQTARLGRNTVRYSVHAK